MLNIKSLEVEKASAGSGKTFLLVRKYLTLMLGYRGDDGKCRLYLTDKSIPNNAHRYILAITFTVKATDEMKKRIVKQLSVLASGEKSPYLDDLMKTYSADEPQIRRSAHIALTQLLFNFSQFNVSTIDAFFQQILRSLAYELDQVGDFGIEANDTAVLDMAVQDLINSLRQERGSISGEEASLRRKMERYIVGRIENQNSWKVFQPESEETRYGTMSLNSILKYINTESFKLISEQVKDYFQDTSRLDRFKAELDSRIKDSLSQCAKLGMQFFREVESLGIDESDFSRINTQPIGVMVKLRDLAVAAQPLYRVAEILPNETYLKKYEYPAEWFKPKAYTALERRGVDFNSLQDILYRFVVLCNERLLMTILSENLDALSLIYDVYKNMETYRTDNDTVLISQTSQFLSRIVSESETPFIYERMGVMLRHFLIDEFQDTSKLQWQNLLPLLKESLAYGNDNLIIGDVKQSIYRFRNADPDLLHYKIFDDLGGYISQDGARKSTNYRSRENIIRFNNDFFKSLSCILAARYNAQLIADTYANVEQNIDKTGTGGYITVAGVSGNTKEDRAPIVFEKMLAIICGELERGYKPCEITILASTGKEVMDCVGELLKNRDMLSASSGSDVTVVSDESLLLSNSAAVSAVIEMLEFISGELSTADYNNSNRAYYYPLIVQQFHRNMSKMPDSPSEALEQALSVSEESLREQLREHLDVDNASLFTVVERIISSFDAEMCANESAYLLALQDVVLEFTTSKETVTIPAFLKWWKYCCHKLSVTSPPNENAINVMTIHKSKGLEFQCVILPFCNWDLLKLSNIMWLDTSALKSQFDVEILPPVVPVSTKGKFDDKKSLDRIGILRKSEYFGAAVDDEVVHVLADKLNLTYVAFTRAVSELHIIYDADDKDKDNVNNFIPEVLNSDEAIIEFGEPTSPLHPYSATEEDNVDMRVFGAYKASKNLVVPRYSVPDVADSPRVRGVALHKVMEKIRSSADVHRAVEWCAARGVINDDRATIDEVVAQFDGYVRQAEPSEWFSPENKSIRERWIWYKGMSRRCDRIVQYPDGRVVVIDFKFGESDDKSVRKKYEKQILDYMSALRESGFSNVVGKIWHPESGEINTIL